MNRNPHWHCHDNFCPTHGYSLRLAKCQHLKSNIQEDYPALMVRVSTRAYLMDWHLRDMRKAILEPLRRKGASFVWRWHWHYGVPHLHCLYLDITNRDIENLIRRLCFEALEALKLPNIGPKSVSVVAPRTNTHACLDYLWEVNHREDNPLPPLRCPPRVVGGRRWGCTQDIA